MERVEVRLNLEVPPNSRLYEVRQLISSRFENVHWLDLCEDDHLVAEDRRPLIASVSRVSSDLACDFIEDETFPDWSVVEPSVDIEKGWRVRNSGTRDWPEGTCLRQCWGELGMSHTALVPRLKVNEEGVIRVPISLPAHNGHYQVHFRLFHPDHGYFGHKLWCNVIVREDSSVQDISSDVLDELEVELPACFDLETTPPSSPAVQRAAQSRTCAGGDFGKEGASSRMTQGPSMATAMHFRHKPRQQQYRLEAEALPEALLTGALSACSSIYNAARTLIEPRKKDGYLRRGMHSPSPDSDR
ncbi:next to BRCA1 gene 1 protein-like isoform X2 [Varroa jacobsoni]|uniref:Nbr1 FW domain-containing protein n=1 Tax=Varroa destructor TaxID=109461 RepID=A0A7M7KIT8_VARDE|nr:next to BRCA1 gene 1 protein-like isoform X2 [Varroa destructor]XP_022690517.1 next to BRCA1 gene 1 protein-like isoform X2 [Varroa jacobsoni]